MMMSKEWRKNIKQNIHQAGILSAKMNARYLNKNNDL
jgi:hypothetical protein